MLPESSSNSTTSSRWTVAVSEICGLWPGLVPAVVSAGDAVRFVVPVITPPDGGAPGAVNVTVSVAVPEGGTCGRGVPSVKAAGRGVSTPLMFSGPVPLLDTCTPWVIVSLISEL